MEALIGTFLGYLISNIKKSKGAQKAGDELSTAIWDWVHPIFLKDEKPLKDLQDNPDAEGNQKEVAIKVKEHLANHPAEVSQLETLLQRLQASDEKPAGNVYNFGNVEKQVNNPNIQGNFNM